MGPPVLLYVLPHAALPLQAVGVAEHPWPAFQQHELFGMAVGKGTAHWFEVPSKADRALAVLQLLFSESRATPATAVQRFGAEKKPPPVVDTCLWWTGSTSVAAFLSDAGVHLGASHSLKGDALQAAIEQDRRSLRGGDLVLAPPAAGIVRTRLREVGWSLDPTRNQLARFDRDVLADLPSVFDALQLEVADSGEVAKLRGVARADKLAQARTLVDSMRRLVLWAPYGQALRPVRGQGLRTLPGAHQAPPFLDLSIQWPARNLPPLAGPRELAVQQILSVLAELPAWQKLAQLAS